VGSKKIYPGKGVVSESKKKVPDKSKRWGNPIRTTGHYVLIPALYGQENFL
jgi:hypothetical protein